MTSINFKSDFDECGQVINHVRKTKSINPLRIEYVDCTILSSMESPLSRDGYLMMTDEGVSCRSINNNVSVRRAAILEYYTRLLENYGQVDTPLTKDKIVSIIRYIETISDIDGGLRAIIQSNNRDDVLSENETFAVFIGGDCPIFPRILGKYIKRLTDSYSIRISWNWTDINAYGGSQTCCDETFDEFTIDAYNGSVLLQVVNYQNLADIFDRFKSNTSRRWGDTRDGLKWCKVGINNSAFSS